MKPLDLDSLKENSVLLISAEIQIQNIISTYDIKFDNLLNIEFNIDDSFLNKLIEKINNQKIDLILYGHTHIYGKILPYLNNNIRISWIYSNTIADFSSQYNYLWFKSIFDYYNRGLLSNIIVKQKDLYKILKKENISVSLLDLKYNKSNTEISNFKNFNTIGIIAIDYEPYENIYNQLSAITLLDEKYNVKLYNPMIVTKKFCERFEIKYKSEESLDNVIENNYVNLYCKFTNINPYYFFKSMDMGIPCIMGNTDLLDDNKILKDLLVLKSDDDVNEIADKVKNIKNNYDLIFKEYKNIRKKVDYEKC